MPVTVHLAVPGTRLVNVLLLLVVVLATGAMLRHLRQPWPFATASTIFVVPVVLVTSGMALTEVPAMACFYPQLLLLLIARDEKSLGIACVEAAVAGGLLSLAILGRQQYLLVVLVSPFVLVGAWLTLHFATVHLCFVCIIIAWPCFRGLGRPRLASHSIRRCGGL